MHVKSEKRNPSNTPKRVSMNAKGPGMKASQPSKFWPTHLKKKTATMQRPKTDMHMM